MNCQQTWNRRLRALGTLSLAWMGTSATPNVQGQAVTSGYVLVASQQSGLESPRGVTISPDGKTAFVTLNADRSVAVVDLTTRNIVRQVGVGASPDGVGFGPSF